MAEALSRARFRSAYAGMLDQVLQRRLPLAVCTIYEARFPEPATRRLAATALTTLDDAITREKPSPATSIASTFASFATTTVTIEPWLRPREDRQRYPALCRLERGSYPRVIAIGTRSFARICGAAQGW